MSFKHSNSEFFEYCKLKFAHSLSPHKNFLYNIKLNFFITFYQFTFTFNFKGVIICLCFWILAGKGGLLKKGINKGKHESITLVFNKEIR